MSAGSGDPPAAVEVAAGEGGMLGALESRTAGDRIIRGGALRSAGYVFSTGATAVAFAFLLRHLGVADFGRYATVIALVTIASGLAEAGLTTIGQRRYAAAPDDGARRRLLGDLVGIRLALTPLAVMLAAAFGVLAGYDATMITGVLVAGAGAVLTVTALTVSLPLAVHLRFRALTALEVSRQLMIVAGIATLVALDATLGPFFLAYLVAGLVMVGLAVALVDRSVVVAPRLRPSEWKPILKQAGPLAVAMAINSFYLRLLIVLASVLVTEEEVGLFAAASRITEVLVGLPTFMVGAAFPLLAHAGARDEARLAYALQRIAEVAALVAFLFVVVLEVGAEPIVRLFGGADFAGVVPVVRIQALALVGASFTQVWVLGIVAVERQRSLVWVNLVALVSVAILGLALIPGLEARGASIAAALGETILACATLVALVRARPALLPDFRFLPRLALAAGSALLLLLSPLPAAVDAGLAAVVYLGAAWLLRAIPVEVARAFLKK